MPDNEWSGPIMYKLVGNFATGKFHCVVKDIYPMAKGSSAYTEYDFNEDFIKYRMAHPESLEWEVGNIHSHNNMATFFSGTDTNDLQENSLSHNYYLSLIINNNLDTTAKISFIGEQETKQNVTKSFFGDNGRLYKFNTKETKKEKVLFVYNCKIDLDYKIKVSEDFSNRVDEIIVKYDKEKVKPKVNIYNPSMMGNVGQFDLYDDFGYSEVYNRPTTKKEDGEFSEKDRDAVEQLLTDSLVGEYGAKDSLDEAMFKANKDFIANKEESINSITMFIETLGAQYLDEIKLSSDKFYETLIELIFKYETDFNKFCNALVEEILEEVE